MRRIATIIIWISCLFGCEEGQNGATSSANYDDVDTACNVTFSQTTERSAAISTVGIVEWQSSLSKVDSAYIEFGETRKYGLKAPVDLTEKRHRTLLLGMKPLRTYHYRIVALSGDKTCRSGDHTLETGGQPTALGIVKATTVADAKGELYGGYIVSSMIKSPYAFIIDADGEYVWWYEAPISTISRARMSADGTKMLIGNLNLRNNGIGAIVKVTMDGLKKEVIQIPNRHHDFTVLPNSGTIAYIEYEQAGLGTCDRLMERSEDGEERVVYTIRDDFAHRAVDEEWCHANAVNYDPGEDVYYLSVLKLNAILKIDRASGALLWVLGGGESTFEGPSWNHQHQHQLLENGNILLFSNGFGGFVDAERSLALEYVLEGNVATETWRYEGGAASSSLGDVQRLGNGNTMVTYSNAGLIHEVETASQTLLRTYAWPDSIVAYTIRRDSLYGGPQDNL